MLLVQAAASGGLAWFCEDADSMASASDVHASPMDLLSYPSQGVLGDWPGHRQYMFSGGELILVTCFFRESKWAELTRVAYHYPR